MKLILVAWISYILSLMDLHLPNNKWVDFKWEVTRPSREHNSKTFTRGNLSGIMEHHFDQLINHKSNETFKQRYFINEYYYQPQGPIFLYLGGEGEIVPDMINSGIIKLLARRYRGKMYCLEHRYYGESQPYSNLTTDNLKYLSSDYALKDIQYFIKTINNQQPTNNKWFVIGGSYGGMLAAWSRQKFPKLIYGALASSAPVNVKSDFFEYDEIIYKSLGPKCAEDVSKVVNKIDKLYSTNYKIFEKIKSKLECESIKDDTLMMGIIYDTLSYTVQYNIKNETNNKNIFCDNHKYYYYLHHFLDVAQTIVKNNSNSCQEYSGLSSLSQIEINPKSYIRQWVYQCCTEFGFWQISHPQTPMRSKLLTKAWYENFYCSSQFFNNTIGPPNITQTLLKNYPNITRIIFTNGKKDPWSSLSLINSKSSHPERPIIYIPYVSHTSDLNLASYLDPPELQRAHDFILFIFDHWVQMAIDYKQRYRSWFPTLFTSEPEINF